MSRALNRESCYITHIGVSVKLLLRIDTTLPITNIQHGLFYPLNRDV